ncbi:hypothetical protein HAALTHF_43180n [Vreelandella aquamarina]|nr:hypothetical protein HAALTHF_43180n [Halomonas axialensis]
MFLHLFYIVIANGACPTPGVAVIYVKILHIARLRTTASEKWLIKQRGGGRFECLTKKQKGEIASPLVCRF